MKSAGKLCWVASALVVLLGMSSPCAAGLMWFDETGGGSGYSSFGELTAAQQAYMAGANSVITFNDLAAGTTLGNQYAASYSVRFLNTAKGKHHKSSGVYEEGGDAIGTLTGYDGSYMPDGDQVVLRLSNHIPGTVFTILFDDPVCSVGAFFAVGQGGSIHSVEISVFDVNNNLLGQRDVESWLWESSSPGQRYESFFGLTTDDPVIGRVEVLKNSCLDSANMLMLDNLAFSRTGMSLARIPEPMSALLLVLGLGGLEMLNLRRVRG